MKNINSELKELFRKIKENSYFKKGEDTFFNSKPKNLDSETESTLQKEVKKHLENFFESLESLLLEQDKKWNFWIENVRNSKKLRETIFQFLNNLQSSFDEKHNNKTRKRIKENEEKVETLNLKQARYTGYDNEKVWFAERITKIVVFILFLFVFGWVSPLVNSILLLLHHYGFKEIFVFLSDIDRMPTKGIFLSFFFASIPILPIFLVSYTQQKKIITNTESIISIITIFLLCLTFLVILFGLTTTLVCIGVAVIIFLIILGSYDDYDGNVLYWIGVILFSPIFLSIGIIFGVLYFFPSWLMKIFFKPINKSLNQIEYDFFKIQIKPLREEVKELKSSIVDLGDKQHYVSHIMDRIIEPEFSKTSQNSIVKNLTENTSKYIADFNQIPAFLRKEKFLWNFYYNGINELISQLNFLKNDEKLNIKGCKLEREDDFRTSFVIYTEPSYTITTSKLNSIKENLLIFLKRSASKYTERGNQNVIIADPTNIDLADVMRANLSGNENIRNYFCNEDVDSMILFDYDNSGYEYDFEPKFSPILEQTFSIPQGFFDNLRLDIEERGGQIALVFTNTIDKTVDISDPAIRIFSDKINQVLIKNDVKGYEEDFPELVSYRSIDADDDNIYTFGLTFKLPEGVGRKQILGMEDKINAVIAPAKIEEVNGNDAELELIVRKGVRSKTSFTLADAVIDKTKLEIPIGFRVDGGYGEQVMIEMKEENNAHMMVVGATGSGKTNTVLYFLTNLLKRFSPDKLKIAITVNNQDFEAFDEYPDYHYLPRPNDPMDPEDTPKTIVKLFAKLDEEQRKREALFRQWNQKYRGINNLHKYHEKSKGDPEMPKIPFIYVVFEEIGVNISQIERLATQIEAENMEETKKLRTAMKSFNSYLGEILRYCRKYGIYFIFMSQVVGDMKSTIKENVRYKLAHQIAEKQSLSLFEKPDAAKLEDKQGLIQIGTDNTNLIKFKSPLAETEVILEELKKSMDKK